MPLVDKWIDSCMEKAVRIPFNYRVDCEKTISIGEWDKEEDRK